MERCAQLQPVQRQSQRQVQKQQTQQPYHHQYQERVLKQPGYADNEVDASVFESEASYLPPEDNELAGDGVGPIRAQSGITQDPSNATSLFTSSNSPNGASIVGVATEGKGKGNRISIDIEGDRQFIVDLRGYLSQMKE